MRRVTCERTLRNPRATATVQRRVSQRAEQYVFLPHRVGRIAGDLADLRQSDQGWAGFRLMLWRR